MNICSNELTLNCFKWGKCSWNIFSLIKYYDHPFHMFEFTWICWIFKAIKYHVFIWFLIQWEEEEMTLPRCTCKIFARLLYSECSEIDNARVIWPNERKKRRTRIVLYLSCNAQRTAHMTLTRMDTWTLASGYQRCLVNQFTHKTIFSCIN